MEVAMVADVEVPAGFVPQYAMAFGAVDGPAVAVHADNPLPVRTVRPPASAGALAGSMTASGMAGRRLIAVLASAFVCGTLFAGARSSSRSA
jgi:hypothetical protein